MLQTKVMESCERERERERVESDEVAMAVEEALSAARRLRRLQEDLKLAKRGVE
jgi:hypothetical protein